MAYRKNSTNVSFVNFPHFLFPLTDGKFLQDVSYTHPTSNITDSQELNTHMPEVSQITICTSSLILCPTLHFGILPSSYCILLTCIPNPSSELSFNIPLLYLPRILHLPGTSKCPQYYLQNISPISPIFSMALA